MTEYMKSCELYPVILILTYYFMLPLTSKNGVNKKINSNINCGRKGFKKCAKRNKSSVRQVEPVVKSPYMLS